MNICGVTARYGVVSKNPIINLEMSNKNLSVHLQNFPDLSFIKEEEQLVKDMDLVKDICSAALFIRDQQNLRVRLPLNKLTIIGSGADINNINQYKEIIAEEVNVKNIVI